MTRLLLRLLLLFTAASMASSCTGCDGNLAATGPTSLATFNVRIGNVGPTTAFFYQSTSFGTTHYFSLAPGESAQAPQNEELVGQNGDPFTFSAYNSAGAVLATGTCTLNNAEDALLFTREIDFNLDANLFHCQFWGNGN